MAEKFKSDTEIFALAVTLKTRREELGLTLELLGKFTGIDCGQLSRFETGQFKTKSQNLQIVCKFLQLTGWLHQAPEPSHELGDRLEQFARRSPAHHAAVEELLRALEKLP
ncbi:helix-turn-helix domain-containing protein [Chitinivorax sp. B]|uniref:helix-turn-helix domain-containing protein n=1 Tax=Chitinivorax sp. B TaxID=2502235 RepID=UPI00148568F5|nr:helix-turn-helix domain-containing protein [Chitinivorax sp. B]